MNNRIDRIDGSKYYEYTKIKNLNVSDAEEKFSLDYKQDDLQAEAKEKKDKDKAASEKEAKQEKANSGVKLEISNSGRVASASKPRVAPYAKGNAGNATGSLLDSVREAIVTVIAAVKDFFYKVWNDPEQPDTKQGVQGGLRLGETETAANAGLSVSDEVVESTKMDGVEAFEEAVPESAESQIAAQQRLDRVIQPYLRNGDLNQVISLLTDHGRKTAARNSTLLTYYDRNGRMTEPSASDRERILYGDRNTRKL